MRQTAARRNRDRGERRGIAGRLPLRCNRPAPNSSSSERPRRRQARSAAPCRRRAATAATGRPAPSAPSGWRGMRCSLTIQGPGLGSRLRSAGMKATAGTEAQGRGRAPRNEHRSAGGSRSAVPSAAPRNGPAQGVATKAASAPVQSCRVGQRPPADRRHLEQPAEVQRDRRREQQQDAGSCAGPAAGTPSRPALPPAGSRAGRRPSAPVPTMAPPHRPSASRRASRSSPPLPRDAAPSTPGSGRRTASG